MMKIHYLLATWLSLSLLVASCKKDDDPGTDELPTTIETQPAVLTPVTQNISSTIGGYYEALPALYNENQHKYPVLIFLPGAGQYGNGSKDELPRVLNEGIGLLLKQQKLPPDFLVNGQHFSFIVLIPQFKSGAVLSDIRAFVDHAYSKYRVDRSYFYLSGFSLGGRQATEFSANYPTEPAAIVTMAGAFNYNLPASVKGIADKNLPVWSFHNEEDQMIPSQETKAFISAINGYKPAVPAKQTIFPTSDAVLKHDCWTKVSDPAYKEGGMNIYEWMLSHKR